MQTCGNILRLHGHCWRRSISVQSLVVISVPFLSYLSMCRYAACREIITDWVVSLSFWASIELSLDHFSLCIVFIEKQAIDLKVICSFSYKDQSESEKNEFNYFYCLWDLVDNFYFVALCYVARRLCVTSNELCFEKKKKKEEFPIVFWSVPIKQSPSAINQSMNIIHKSRIERLESNKCVQRVVFV